MRISKRRRSLPGYNAEMINSQRISIALLVVVISACASAPPEPRPEGRGQVEVTMTGFKNQDGTAQVALFIDPAGWPDGESSVFATAVAPISDGEAVALFEDVPAGPFAVSAFHDEDGNGELNSAALGIPSEPYGFSAGASNLFGPPGFKEATIELAAGETQRITIKVK